MTSAPVATTTKQPESWPPWNAAQIAAMADADSNALMIDVESCNPSVGPVRAIAFVLMAYKRFHHEIIDRVQIVVQRNASDYTDEGLKFWKEIARPIDDYLNHSTTHKVDPATAAQLVRSYLDHCWATVPRLAILIDEPQTDHALLYAFLKEYGLRPVCRSADGGYKPLVHVSRDLMRGAYSMIDPRYVDLDEKDMYLAIHRYWQQLAAMHMPPPLGSPRLQASEVRPSRYSTTTSSGVSYIWRQAPPTTMAAATGPWEFPPPKIHKPLLDSVFRSQLGPETKHAPVWDALQTLLVWARMEDIKRLFHLQLAKLVLTVPSLVTLPKSTPHTPPPAGAGQQP
jgi:hypothetical protein